MNSKFRNLSQKARGRIRRGLIRSWQPGGTHREMQLRRGLRSDADTARKRAQHDAKGRLEFFVEYPDGSRFEIRRSLRGRPEQLDAVDAGGLTTSTASEPRTIRFLIQLASELRHSHAR